jgi:hypothetical protein
MTAYHHNIVDPPLSRHSSRQKIRRQQLGTVRDVIVLFRGASCIS